MNIFRAAVCAATCALSLAVTSESIKPFGFSDLSLGVSVAALIKSHGPPNVVTTDVGHIWTWDSAAGKVRVSTDDDGIVHLFDVLPSPKKPVSFALPGTPPLLLNFGLMTAAQADIQYKSLAFFSANTVFPDSAAKAVARGLRIGPLTEAVMLFDDASQTLREVSYGEQTYLARAGFLPPNSVDPSPAKITAPVLVHQGSSDYPATKIEGDTFVRIVVDQTGKVSGATVFATAGDINLDRAAIASAKSYTFKPATKDGVPVASIFFHKEPFRTVPLKP